MNLFEKAVNGDEFLFRQLLSFEKLLKEGKVSRLLLIEKASENGNINATKMLGDMYFKGIDVQKDIKKAIKYYSISSDKGNLKSTYNLGIIYLNGDVSFKRDISKAISFLERCVNSSRALYNLGVIYENGVDEVYRNLKKAKKYYSQSAFLGNKLAENNLANFYKNGIEGKKSIKKAITLYERSGSKGNDKAHYNLGMLYLIIRKDNTLASKYLKLSSKAGNEQATRELELLSSNLKKRKRS